MTHRHLIGSMLVLVALGFGLAARSAPDVRPAPATQDAEAPLAVHAFLLSHVGDWEGTLTMPSEEGPVSVPAKETVTAVGKLWTQARFTSQFGEMPYVGTGALGFDVHSKKMRGTWVDSWSTQLAVMEGTFDEKKKSVTMQWTMRDPESGQDMKHRSVTTYDGADAYVSDFYIGDGEGTKFMTIAMKRKKAPTAPAGAK
ncbi:MAG: DUF1579 family protein [Planctomycetota bacterium]